MTVVFYNGACSKCRKALDLLRERGESFQIVEYLTNPPSRATLENVLDHLDAEPSALVRRDKHFAELGLTDEDCATSAQVLDVLIAHPELMERPVVVRGDRAVIARPPERLLELL